MVLNMSYSYDEVFNASLAYFGGDELAAKVFVDKYALQDNEGNYKELTPDDMHRRLAKEFARIEAKYSNPLSEEEIYGFLKEFRYIVPQGSPMFGIGNNFVNVSLSNCVVVESPEDSMSGILDSGKELANLYKNRCGVGIDISTLRPEGSPVNNAAKTTTGAWSFADFYSYVTRMVGQFGRRGACMITLDVRHPDVFQFVTMKRDLQKVTGANVSLRITDDFMKSVKNSEKFLLRFPVDSSTPLFTKEIEAKELWETIVESATTSAEPGLIMWDNVVSTLPAHCYPGFKTISTNPCSELPLSAADSCRLISITLKHFVLDRFTSKARFDWKTFENVVRKAMRLSDDLVDLELEKLQKIIESVSTEFEKELWGKLYSACSKGRRTGLGTHGLADMLACMGLVYDSDDSVKFIKKVYDNFRCFSYDESCNLAKERGPFPVFDWETEKHNKFIRNLPASVGYKIRKSGRRNISLLTLAPTGSVSILSQVSSGIEPVFRNSYTRRKKVSNNDVNSKVVFIDDVGDSWEEFEVYHHNVKEWLLITQSEDSKLPDFFITSDKIDWKKRVEIQSVIQENIDHSISSTINLPKGTSTNVVSDLYFRSWEKGLKGVTVYVDGSRSGVLVSKEEVIDKISYTTPPKRPRELECDIHQTSVKGVPWVVFVGFMENASGEKAPYEVFAGESSKIRIPKKYDSGKIIKHPRKTVRSIYDLVSGNGEEELLIRDIVETFDNSIHAAFTRTISLALRHGTPVKFVVEQLQKDKDSDLFSFSRAVARVIKKYIKDGEKPSSDKECPDCKSDSVVYQDGCVICTNCGWGKC